MRRIPPEPIRWLTLQGWTWGRKLDFGCGRFRTNGFYCYDPNWYPELPKGKFDVITCCYVLNVLNREQQKKVMYQIENLLTEEGNAFYVVRRDLPLEGRQGRGCWQSYVTLPLPIVHENRYRVIYQYDNYLSKSIWQ